MDMDGTTYLGHRLLPGAKGFFRLLNRRGIPYLFFTNNSSKDRFLYRDKLVGMGLHVTPDQIITSGEATALYLSTRTPHRRLYVLGTPSLESEFRDAGFVLAERDVDAVVLGFDTTLTYAKLERACHLLRGGAAFVATHPDKVCPTERGPVPDCGSMAALLVKATGVRPVVIGKPNRRMVTMALRKVGPGYRPREVAIVGDRLYTDIRMGRRAGLVSILVLSGETRREELEKTRDIPHYVFQSVRDLTRAMREESPVGTRQTAVGRKKRLCPA
jgi:HAD superfamily hydrolase (TIGR01457 family)